MVNSPKSEVIEGGGKLARALNDKGVEVTFGKRSEGNDDLSTVIDMAANQINSSSNVDIVTEWEEILSDEKVPSEKLTKNTLDIKADKTNGVSQITDPNAHSNLGTNANATQSSINSAIDSMIGSNVSIGTFTDLKNTINDANGVLVLDRDYKYDATVDTSVVLDYGIPIEKNITIIGNGHIIDGNDTVRALSISGEYVVNLYDLRIQNCKSTINAFGGAIYIEDTTVNMINLQIINNSVVGDGSVGGAIAAWDSTVNITNTEFIQNKVTGIETRAGAIFIIGNISLNNCTFEDNTATLRAGAIHANGALSMIDCSFKDNTATNYANIYSNNTVTVYDCIIPNINTSCYNVSNITTELLNTSKQNTLVSGTNIRTINGESILGNGNINTPTTDVSGKEDTSNKVTSWSNTTTDTHYPSEKLVKDNLDTKQATLVSGTNIKTINNESILGSGNINISGGGSSVDIVTSWESTPSDSKVPSEKLTKDTLDNKIDTAGTGLSKSGTTLNHSNSVTAQTSTALKKIKYDAQGHITGTDSVAAGDLPSHTHNYATTSDVDTEIESYFNQINSQAGAYDYILNLVYPVGSIYITVNSTSPAVLFGGSWTQLTNAFLYASTTADTNATTAPSGQGEATHTLTTNEMPSHSHTFMRPPFGWDEYQDGGDIISGTVAKKYVNQMATSSTGGGEAHNNMPPYIKVYMWKRTG